MTPSIRQFTVTIAYFVALVCACAQTPNPVTMTAHFINVGQGAATLLEFPCGLVLIDTGGAKNSTPALINYVESVFQRRTDLKRTLESVIITHPHADHTLGLQKVMERFAVKRYLDDGETTGSGRFGPQWVRKAVQSGAQHAKIIEMKDEKITKAGLTNEDIDPLKCDRCDPKITVLSGGYRENPGWSEADFENLNNHSVVTRVDFGGSTFLFSGDLEEAGIEHLLKRYRKTKMLDVDVYNVGHHGAANATNSAFLAAITPHIAVICMGVWNEGQNPYNPFSTYAYGHPRLTILEALSLFIEDERQPAKSVKAGIGARKFTDFEVEKKIYGTGWDGTIRVTAGLDGKYDVCTN